MKIFIFHANAGHGHRKVAEVIHGALQDSKKGVTLKIGDALDWTPSWFKWLYPAIYFNSVKNTPKIWGWFYETSDIAWVYKFIQPLRSLFNRLIASRLLAEVVREKPDVIITTHFLSAELFATAKKKGLIQSQLITVITDFFPHTFWLNDGNDIYWVMADESKTALIKRGIPQTAIVPEGIPVDKSFKPTGGKSEILKRYGWDSSRLTLLITSGSFGLGPQEKIIQELRTFADKVQCFVVCGNNLALKESLDKLPLPFPVKVFGFVDFMAELMEASDLMIAKSGGSTTTESLAKGIPMIVLEPIPGQETRNAALLKMANTSFFLHTPEQVNLILKQIIENPALLAAKKREILKLARPNASDKLVEFIMKDK